MGEFDKFRLTDVCGEMKIVLYSTHQIIINIDGGHSIKGHSRYSEDEDFFFINI